MLNRFGKLTGKRTPEPVVVPMEPPPQNFAEPQADIDPAKTKKDAFLKFVPSGVATAAELQSKGFAYIKVG